MNKLILKKFDAWLVAKVSMYFTVLPFYLFLIIVSLLDQYVFNNALRVSNTFDNFVKANIVNPYDMFFFYFICLSGYFLDRYKQKKSLRCQEV